MKKYIILFLISMVTIAIIFLYKKNALTLNKEIIQLKSHVVNLCGFEYAIITKNNDLEYIQKSFDSINYNLTNDDFPKPGSGDKIYENMSDVSQNIRYSFRPKAVAEKICSQLPKNINGLELDNIKTSNNNYSFILNKNIAISFNLETQMVSSDPNISDQSGMGGYSNLFYGK